MSLVAWVRLAVETEVGAGMTSKLRPTIPALTGMRFFAALSVAICHFTQLGIISVPVVITDFLDGGRPAVSLFFILSGFILSYTYAADLYGEPKRAFYLARFARIYPMVLLSLLISSVSVAYLLNGNHRDLMLAWFSIKEMASLALAVSLACQLLLLTAWFPIASINQPWNGPAWSISCEAFFYAIFPWLARMLRAQSLVRLAAICFTLWMLQGAWIHLVDLLLPNNRKGFIISQFPITHLFEFVIGCAATIVFTRMRATSASPHRYGIAFVSTSLMAIAILGSLHPVRPAYYVLSPLFALLILGLALLERPVIGLLNRKLVILLGEASFALYLIHVPIGHLLEIAGVGGPTGWLGFLMVICISIVAFKYFEEPMRKRIRATASPLVQQRSELVT